MLVLCDLDLPDSYELDRLARLQESPLTPVIVFTGPDDHSLALQAVRAGAQDRP